MLAYSSVTVKRTLPSTAIKISYYRMSHKMCHEQGIPKSVRADPTTRLLTVSRLVGYHLKSRLRSRFSKNMKTIFEKKDVEKVEEDEKYR